MWTCSFHHERMSAALPSGIFSGSAGSLRYMSSSVSAGAGGAGASSASSSSDLRGRSKMSWWEEPWRDSAADAGRSLPGAGAGAGAGAGGPAFLFVAAGFAGAAALRFVRTALDKLCRLARGQHSAEQAASQHPAEGEVSEMGSEAATAAPATWGLGHVAICSSAGVARAAMARAVGEVEPQRCIDVASRQGAARAWTARLQSRARTVDAGAEG